MSAHWYALCSKPHKEDVLWNQLQAFSIDVYFPRYLAKTGSLNVMKVKPYFPGYLFVNTDLEKRGVYFFQHMPFANGLVFIAEKPALVPEELISAVKKRLTRVNLSVEDFIIVLQSEDSFDSLGVVLSQYQAIFDASLTGSERVLSLLHILELVAT